MDNRNVIEEIFQAFQDLMVKLNLEDNIIGYTLYTVSAFIVYNSSCQDLDHLLCPEKSEELQNCLQLGPN